MSASRARRFGGRLAVAAVLSALLLPAVNGPGGSTPAEASTGSTARTAGTQALVAAGPAAQLAAKSKGSSWKTERTEEFSGSSIPDGCEEYTEKNLAGKNAWTKDSVDVSEGLLQLKLAKRKTSGQPYTAGGIGCWGWPQKYGKFEIKAKVPAGKGIDASLTLWPAKSTKNDATAFTGMDLLAPGPETAYVTNGYGTKSETARVNGKYSGEFRDYVIEWAPKHVRMTVDGKEIYYSTQSFKKSRWLGLVVSTGDALTGVPDGKTKLPARLQIDRIKISSYTGIPPKAQTKTPDKVVATSAAPAKPSATASITPAAKVPATTAPTKVTSLEATSATTGPALAGGVWPWLLGGSLIAVFAVFSLNYPHQRRARREAQQPRQ